MVRINRETEPKKENKERLKGILEITFGLAVIVGAGALIFLYRREIIALSAFGYVGVFFIALLSAATIFVPAPGLAIAASLALVLNPLLIGVAGGIGAAIGELSGYVVGRGVSDVRQKELLNTYSVLVEKYEASAIILLAAIPNPLFDIVGIAAGALKIPWQRFFLAVLIGNIIKYAAIALLVSIFGSSILSYLEALSL